MCTYDTQNILFNTAKLHCLMALTITSVQRECIWQHWHHPHIWLSSVIHHFWLWYEQNFGNKTYSVKDVFKIKHRMHDGRHRRWNGQTLPCCRSSHSASSIDSMFDTVFVMLSRSSGLTHRSAIRIASSKICRRARSPAPAAGTLLHLHQILCYILQRSTSQQTGSVIFSVLIFLW